MPSLTLPVRGGPPASRVDRLLIPDPNRYSPGYCAGNLKLSYGPNGFDRCLVEETAWWRALVAAGGLERVCCPPGRVQYQSPPWMRMPAEGRRFQAVEVLGPLNSLPVGWDDGTDRLVLTTTVPYGYDGVLTGIVTLFSGTGFQEGSGDITWRVQNNLRWIRDYGNIQESIGSLTSASLDPRLGSRLYSRQVLRIYVAFAAGAAAVLDPDGRIIVAMQGWFYPR
jgi:hypothetical protein